MASTDSLKAKLATSDPPRALTRFEIASLRHEMRISSDWMRKELKRRHKFQKQQKPAAPKAGHEQQALNEN